MKIQYIRKINSSQITGNECVVASDDIPVKKSVCISLNDIKNYIDDMYGAVLDELDIENITPANAQAVYDKIYGTNETLSYKNFDTPLSNTDVNHVFTVPANSACKLNITLPEFETGTFPVADVDTNKIIIKVNDEDNMFLTEHSEPALVSGGACEIDIDKSDSEQTVTIVGIISPVLSDQIKFKLIEQKEGLYSKISNYN